MAPGPGRSTVWTSTEVKVEQSGFNESKQPDLTAKDVRFTTKGKTLYAFVMGLPMGELAIKPLGTHSTQQPGKIENVELLGYQIKLRWKQENDALKIKMPLVKTSDIGVTFKVTMV